MGASLFLIALFLATLGSLYTGYSVLEPNQLTLSNYPYPFVKNGVTNGVYIVLPYDYTYSEYNVAEQIATSLAGSDPMPPTIVTDNEMPMGDYNLVLIGNACNNQLIFRELNTMNCNLNLLSGQGLLKLLNHDRTSTLIVSGDSEGMMKAVVVLNNYNFYPLTGREVIVEGEMGNLVLNYGGLSSVQSTLTYNSGYPSYTDYSAVSTGSSYGYSDPTYNLQTPTSYDYSTTSSGYTPLATNYPTPSY